MLFFCVFQSPPKGATIPYRPKPQVAGPVILAGGQAYTIQGNYAVPAHAADVSTMPLFPGLAPVTGHPSLGLPPSPLLHTGLADPLLKNGHLQAALPPAHLAADVSLCRQRDIESAWHHPAPPTPTSNFPAITHKSDRFYTECWNILSVWFVFIKYLWQEVYYILHFIL